MVLPNASCGCVTYIYMQCIDLGKRTCATEMIKEAAMLMKAIRPRPSQTFCPASISAAPYTQLSGPACLKVADARISNATPKPNCTLAQRFDRLMPLCSLKESMPCISCDCWCCECVVAAVISPCGVPRSMARHGAHLSLLV
jgi:hypothetical protein